MTRTLFYLTSVAVLCGAATASADPLPTGAATDAPATSGETDVAQSGKFETATKAADATKDATQLQILGGGLLSTGNARSLAATGSAQFRLRRDRDQLSVLAAANYARAAADPASSVKPTVENYQGRLRYDRFLAEEFAVFVAASGRHDRFQHLDLRLNVDPGAAYYFLDQSKHQFWGELGYDFQFDVNSQAAIDAGSPDTKVRHSARAFVGYHNALNEAVDFATGLEYIQGVSDTEAFRLNYDASLTSKIGGHFSLATTFSLKYDHDPLPGVKDTDTTTAVSLVYQLL